MDTNAYTCPGGHVLTFQSQSKDGKVSKYSNKGACASCENCKNCAKSKDGVRKIERDMDGDGLRDEAKKMAQSNVGREILRLRKSVPEPVWGNMQVQNGFTQMHYRGLEKAGLEFKLHCIVQNIRKLLKVYFNSKSFQEDIHSREREHQSTA